MVPGRDALIDMVIYLFLLILALLTLLVLFGRSRWNRKSGELRRRLLAAYEESRPGGFDPEAVKELPEAVQRYLRRVLEPGQEAVSSVELVQRGTFNMSESGELWRPFVGRQLVVTRRPGFLWTARMGALPGLSMRVHDAYATGEGILSVALLGALTVAELRNRSSAAESELMRFLAEAPWYPTLFLDRDLLRWEEIDNQSARATLSDGELSVTLLFRFGDDDLVSSVWAPARGRSLGGKVVPTPWEGRWGSYESRGGILVPTVGEVAWLLPEGRKPYWRGGLTELTYRF